MKTYPTEKIRNVGIIAHQSAGKTSLAEAIVFDAGGNTVFDFLPEEIRRKVSASSALSYAEWNGHLVNVIDTPGYQDFFVDVLYSLRVCDGALLIVSAV